MIHTDPYLQLQTISKKNGLALDDGTVEVLRKFDHLLTDWNSKINLISRADIENIWSFHILHSLSLLFFLDIPQNLRVLDIGTGGGLPGIPLAIVRRDLSVTLLDSIRKKTRVLEDITGNLGLENATVMTGRAENLPHTTRYDLIVARAVAPLADLVKWSKPLANKSGASKPQTIKYHTEREMISIPSLLALKGGNLNDEISIAEAKTGSTFRTIPLVFSGSEAVSLEEKKVVIVPL